MRFSFPEKQKKECLAAAGLELNISAETDSASEERANLKAYMLNDAVNVALEK